MARRPGGQRWHGRAGGVAMLVIAVAACSGGDDGESSGGGGGEGQPEGRALAAAFDEAAEAAYAERGGDREADFTEGVVLDEDCFALDDRSGGVAAVVEALGLDPQGAEIARGTFLNGIPGRQEILTCAIAHGGDRGSVSVTAGTVSYDRDELLDQLRGAADPDEGPVEELDGDAPGLGEDQVLAVSRDGGEVVTFAWIDDGFVVTLGYPSELADPDSGFAALSEAVGAVATSLAGS